MKSQLIKFGEETTLHGFGFAANATQWVHVVLYGIMIVISVIMMVIDGVNLVTQYASEPTRIDFTSMHNSTFTINQPTICFFATSFTTLDSISSYDTRYIMASSSDTQGKFLENFTTSFATLKNFLNNYGYNISAISSEIKNKNFTEWDSFNTVNGLSFSLLFQTISLISLVEFNLSKNSSIAYYVEVGQAEQVRQHLIAKNVDFGDLRDLISLTVCLKSKLSFWGSSIPLNRSFCAVAETSWFGLTDSIFRYDTFPKVCYKFPQSLHFEKSSDWLTIQLEGISNSLNFGDYMCHVKMDISGKQTYYHDYSQSSTIELCTFRQTAKISIKTDISAYNSRYRPCKNYDRLDCLLQCSQRFFIDGCGCFPTTIMSSMSKPANISYCATSSLLNISIELNQTEIPKRILKNCDGVQAINGTIMGRTDCKKMCPNECRVTSLNFLLTEVQQNTIDPSYTTIIISSLTYPYFAESLLLTWSDLLILFGGSIGLW